MVVSYTYTVPESSEAVVVFKLHLVDPIKLERFGDAMTGICSLVQEQPANADLEESKFDLAAEAGEKIAMIDARKGKPATLAPAKR